MNLESGATTSSLTNVQFKEMDGNGFYVNNYSATLTLTNIILEDVGLVGVDFSSGTKIQFSDLSIIKTGSHGLHIYSGAEFSGDKLYLGDIGDYLVSASTGAIVNATRFTYGAFQHMMNISAGASASLSP